MGSIIVPCAGCCLGCGLCTTCYDGIFTPNGIFPLQWLMSFAPSFSDVPQGCLCSKINALNGQLLSPGRYPVATPPSCQWQYNGDQVTATLSGQQFNFNLNGTNCYAYYQLPAGATWHCCGQNVLNLYAVSPTGDDGCTLVAPASVTIAPNEAICKCGKDCPSCGCCLYANPSFPKCWIYEGDGFADGPGGCNASYFNQKLLLNAIVDQNCAWQSKGLIPPQAGLTVGSAGMFLFLKPQNSSGCSMHYSGSVQNWCGTNVLSYFDGGSGFGAFPQTVKVYPDPARTDCSCTTVCGPCAGYQISSAVLHGTIINGTGCLSAFNGNSYALHLTFSPAGVGCAPGWGDLFGGSLNIGSSNVCCGFNAPNNLMFFGFACNGPLLGATCDGTQHGVPTRGTLDPASTCNPLNLIYRGLNVPVDSFGHLETADVIITL